MQEQSQIINISHLYCPKNNSVRLFCCSSTCRQCALVCRKDDCQCLPSHHQNCELVYAQGLIRQVSSKKVAISLEISKAIDKIQKVYEDAINKLSEDREALLKWKQHYGLSQQEIDFLQMINSYQRQQLTGAFIYKIKQGIGNRDDHQGLTEDCVEQFWKRGSIDFFRIFNPLHKLVTQSLRLKPISYESELKFNYNLHFSDQTQSTFLFNQRNNTFQKLNNQQWTHLTSVEQLPKYGRYYFEVQIVNSKNNLAVGIVTQSLKNQNQAYREKNSIKYFAGGTLWKNGEYVQGNPQIKDGKIVRVAFDISNRNVSWLVDGQLLKSTLLGEEFLKQKVYASIETYYRQTKFKII